MSIREFEIVGNQVQALTNAKGLRIGLVRSLFRSALTEQMQAVVEKRAKVLGVRIAEVRSARGALETPLLTQTLLQHKHIDGVVVLAGVIKGQTAHDDVVVRSATSALVQLSLLANKPVGIGIIGPGVTSDQAHERATEYAQGALDAVVLTANQMKNVSKKS
ncbi:6,7-dimethyl-8-ribityllumazine synthase [Candidatus Micrarchaeota archaeon]|nr:6,7-dimethyl-8-ribityllumazine synthase [Candidatus Micrarchaeota archaeon]